MVGWDDWIGHRTLAGLGFVSKPKSDCGTAAMDIKQWATTWEQAGCELSQQRRRELASVDTAAAIESFSKAFRWAVETLPPRPGSGLVQQQAVFARLRCQP